MRNKKRTGRPDLLHNTGVTGLKQVSSPELIQNSDTRIKPPVLNIYGGDTSKRWYIDYHNGEKRVREWIPAKPVNTRQERAERRFLEIKQGVGVMAADCLPELTRLLDKLNLRKKSRQTYLTTLKQFSKYFAGRGLSSITAADAVRYYESLKPKYSDKTRKNKINALKAVLSGYSSNPFADLRGTYNIQESNFNFPFSDFERAEIERELQSNYPELYLFTRFIFYAYIRPKELIHLKVNSIDLRTRTIKIPAEVSKTNRAASVPIIKPLFDLIVANRLTQYPGGFYLFGYGLKPGTEKAPANQATSWHKEAVEKLGLYRERETVLYSWKHTGNIAAYLAGMDIKTIQLINRHRSIETTEIYLRKLGLFLDRRVFEFEY